MKHSRLAAIAFVGMSLFAWTLSSPANAHKNDGKETCASKYPNAPTQPPGGYDHDNESDAYMAFRRAAVKAGYTSVKKVKREKATSGPCMGDGEHLNMNGSLPATTGKKTRWVHVGSMTSCRICEDTSSGPRLRKTLWRIHPKF